MALNELSMGIPGGAKRGKPAAQAAGMRPRGGAERPGGMPHEHATAGVARAAQAACITLATESAACATGAGVPACREAGAARAAEGRAPVGPETEADGAARGPRRAVGRISNAAQPKDAGEKSDSNAQGLLASADPATVPWAVGVQPSDTGAAPCEVITRAVPILDNGNRIQSALTPLTFAEVYTNCRMKIDPRTGEAVEIVLASRPIFKAEDVEAREKTERETGKESDPEALQKAARRAKARLYDLCRFNDFDTFITLTLDDQKVNGFDYKAAVKKLGEWCGNRVQRRGLRYVIVPEKHPTSGRIHFHGLINSDAVKLEDSGHVDKRGRTVYNITDWGYGFTTAVLLDGTYEAVCRYVAKYMTKQENAEARGTLTGRYYYHGGALLEPKYIYFNALSDDDLGEEVKAISIEGTSLTLRYFNPKGGT